MKTLCICALLLASASSISSAAPPQELPPGGVIGLSWVANVTSKQYLGLSLYRVIPKKIGWFVEAKFGRQHSYSTGYYENISVGQAEAWGDELLDEETVYSSYGGGITYAASRSLFLYSGFGMSSADRFREYYDPFEILGNGGRYWVDGRGDSAKPNLILGTMIRASNKVLFHLGYDIEPSGMTIGVGMTEGLPLFRR